MQEKRASAASELANLEKSERSEPKVPRSQHTIVYKVQKYAIFAEFVA